MRSSEDLQGSDIMVKIVNQVSVFVFELLSVGYHRFTIQKRPIWPCLGQNTQVVLVADDKADDGTRYELTMHPSGFIWIHRMSVSIFLGFALPCRHSFDIICPTQV